LDTDMVIFMLRGLKAPARQRARRERALALVARCREAQAKGDIVGLSAITVSELEFGAQNSGDYETEIPLSAHHGRNFSEFPLARSQGWLNDYRVSGQDVGTMSTPAGPGHFPTAHSWPCPTIRQCPTAAPPRPIDHLRQSP